MKDYIEVDNEIFKIQNFEEIYEEFETEMNSFQNKNVSLTRNNMDISVNNYGYKFIDFLHFNNFYILNGRTKGDSIGQKLVKEKVQLNILYVVYSYFPLLIIFLL